MIFEDWDMLIKAHQYSRKEFKNGVWRYYYDKNNNFSRLTHCNAKPLKINASMSASAIVSAASDYIQNVWLADWKAHPDLAICKELKGKTISFESISYKHLSTAGKHSINGKQKRDVQNLIDHVRYLPLAKELLETNGVHTQSRYEEFSAPKKDGSVGLVYQTVSGLAPKGDKNNYVQVTVSQKKYADGKLSNTVYISVVGTFQFTRNSTTKKALAQGDLLSDFTHTQEQIAKSNASNYAKSCSGSAPSPISAFSTSSIPHKRRAVNKSIRFEFENITPTNKYEKMQKAVQCLSKVLRVPIGIEKSEKRGEGFVFKAQEDLTKKWLSFFDDCVSDIYDFTIKYFGLPTANIVSKAASVDVSNLLTHRGRIIYNPETSQPVKKSDWDKFVKTLEKLMRQKYGFAAKRMISESQTLGRLLDRMLQAQEMPTVQKISLDDMRYQNKTFDYIAQNNNAVFDPLSSFDRTRIEIAQMSAGEKITRFTDNLKSDVKQVIIDGIKERKSKNEISQALFDRLSKENRDFRKIADTELQNNYNNAFLNEEVRHAEEGEKVYFRRLEILDGATCPFCRRMNGKIALWSATPLASDKIDDDIAEVAIWDGKDWSGGKDEVCNGVFHPWCRGMWTRYYPPKDKKAARDDAEGEND